MLRSLQADLDIHLAAVGLLFQQYEYDLISAHVANLTISPFDDKYLPGDQDWNHAYITT